MHTRKNTDTATHRVHTTAQCADALGYTNKEKSSGDDRSFQQEMRVLIFYDNQYYVGEVLHTLPEDSDRTSTAFMEQVPKQNILRWDKEDFDTV